MKARWWIIGLVVLAMAMVAGHVYGQSWSMDCGDGKSAIVTIKGGSVDGVCVTVTATRVEESGTPIPVPTLSPTVIPTATRTPGKTPQPTPGEVPKDKWGLCDNHDALQFHTLEGKDSKGEPCHYGQTHGHDPSAADVVAVFGELAFNFVREWETPRENELKHDGNFCTFARDLPLVPKWKLNWTENIAAGIRDVFACVHFHPTHLDGVVTVHSFEVWQRHCNRAGDRWGDDCGFVHFGGHWHTGILHCDYKARHCALVTDPNPIPRWQWIPGTDISGKSADPYRAHFKMCKRVMADLAQNPDGWRGGAIMNYPDVTRANQVIWTSSPSAYGFNKHGGLEVMVLDAAHCLDYEKGLAAGAPGSKEFTQAIAVELCAGREGLACGFDGSVMGVVNAWTDVKAVWDNGALDSNPVVGRVTMTTYTNVYGDLNPGCKGRSATCVPFELKDAYVGMHGFNFSETKFPNGLGPWTEDFDTSPPGHEWISVFRPVHDGH